MEGDIGHVFCIEMKVMNSVAGGGGALDGVERGFVEV